MQQLPLDLALGPRFGREDFLEAPSNAAALAAIEGWPDWPDRVLVLLGPEGAGKSHLAAIWAAAAGALTLTSAHWKRPDPSLWAREPVLIEDADRLPHDETQLFHLLNLVRSGPSSLLITARVAPDLWRVVTPDLLSRLRLGTSARIEPPDDGLMRAVLVKLFADRQLVVDEAVVNYLVGRLDRSIGAARAVVDRLDRTGLAMNRRVTRPMSAMVLDSLQLGAD